MLGKIWGLVLVALAIYVAVEVTQHPELNVRASKPTSAVPAQVANSSKTADQGTDQAPTSDVAGGEAGRPLLTPKSLQEIAEQLSEICDEMQTELKAAKLSTGFADIRLNIREDRLATRFLKERLGQCFRQSNVFQNNAEIEVFSSDFEGENAAHQIQIQVGIFAKKTNDKLFEVGRKFEMAKKNPSLSTRVQK